MKNIILSPLMGGILIMGTGSSFPLDNASKWKDHVEKRSGLSFDVAQNPIDTRSVKEHLDNIRTTFCPSVSDLAQLLDVSRQAIYKWLASNVRPEPDKLAYLQELSKIADTLKSKGISKNSVILKIKNREGMSLFDFLKSKKPHENHLRYLIAEFVAMEKAYLKSGIAQSQSRSKASNDWLSYLSIPTYPEST